MDRSREYVSAHLDVSPGEEKRLEMPSAETPFRILLLGDFSGRANRAAPGPRLRGRKPIAVDLDNFEDVLARMRPQVELQGPDGPIRIRIESLEDFHPESLYQKVPLFEELREHREGLLEPPAAASRPAPVPTPDPLPAVLGSGSLLDDILSGAELPAGQRRPASPFQQTIESLVTPYLQPKPDARQAELAANVEDTINLAMRLVLHHPEFQELEAAWRSVDFLLRGLESGAGLEIHLADLSKQELLDDLSAEDPHETGLYRLLVEDAAETEGETPWAVVAGLYTFEPQADEFRALGKIAGIARDAQAPFIASVSPLMLGCESFGSQPDSDDWRTPIEAEAEEEWNRLRSLPESTWLGLALPRFLLRYPYGKDSIDEFRFEEMTTPPDHADFLWGNPAVACVFLIGESFLQDGWDVEMRGTQITGLPLHTYKVDSESLMTPCAECWMSERMADRFLARGIMPLASIKHSDSVRLIRLQSISRPAARLRARWSR